MYCLQHVYEHNMYATYKQLRLTYHLIVYTRFHTTKFLLRRVADFILTSRHVTKLPTSVKFRTIWAASHLRIFKRCGIKCVAIVKDSV